MATETVKQPIKTPPNLISLYLSGHSSEELDEGRWKQTPRTSDTDVGSVCACLLRFDAFESNTCHSRWHFGASLQSSPAPVWLRRGRLYLHKVELLKISGQTVLAHGRDSRSPRERDSNSRGSTPQLHSLGAIEETGRLSVTQSNCLLAVTSPSPTAY